MDLIEAGFRPKYEAVCVGNKPQDAQHVFFEGLLLQDGLGTHSVILRPNQGESLALLINRLKVSTRTGMAVPHGATRITPADLFVTPLPTTFRAHVRG